MFTYSRPFNPRSRRPRANRLVKFLAHEARLRKLGQGMFVFAGVLGFVLLFQAK